MGVGQECLIHTSKLLNQLLQLARADVDSADTAELGPLAFVLDRAPDDADDVLDASHGHGLILAALDSHDAQVVKLPDSGHGRNMLGELVREAGVLHEHARLEEAVLDNLLVLVDLAQVRLQVELSLVPGDSVDDVVQLLAPVEKTQPTALDRPVSPPPLLEEPFPRVASTYMAHSLGAKRLTPAWTAASTTRFETTAPGSLAETMKFRTTSQPLKSLASSFWSS